MPEPRDHMPAALGRGHLRACHADREQVIGLLQAAFVQGRLGKDELTARVGQALAARTYADLAALTADLPAGLAPAEPSYQPARVRAPLPVRTAAWLMCLGAVLTLADAATVLVTLGAVKSAAVQDVDFAGGRWHIFMLTVIVPALASTPVVAGVWLWLAWANRRGYAWARFAFMAFVGVLTIGSGGDDAYLHPEGQPVLPVPGSNTGKRNRTVVGQLDSRCLLVPKDWPDSDGSGQC
jgi:hypothetical protein